ncbi:hypothetical protein LSH36_93g07053, partial [Paralvinella palmiformis]
CDQRVCSRGETNGTIITPNYPDRYPPNITCKFYLDGLVDKQNLEKTELRFMSFDLPSDEKAGPFTGTGFKAQYQFVTDYAIPGTPATNRDKCHFDYQSYSLKSGSFNSPRNPSHYPPNTECIYEFHGLPNEQIVFIFESFELQANDPDCTHDYVELYMIKKNKLGHEHEILVGHYCGENVPGPMVTDEDSNHAKVVFHSDASHVRSGFRARYEFIHRQTFGELYKCPNAVLKIYTDTSGRPEYEICGGEEGNKIMSDIIISQENYMKIKFISSTSATGGRGFRLSWTEITSATTSSTCDGFFCQINKYCIAESLRCNNIPNCGYGDTSDEPPKCDPSYTNHGILHIILGVVLSLIVLVFIIVCILHRRRKARKKKKKKEIEVRYVTRGGTMNRRDGGPATDKLLKERTEKVSIV